MDPIKHHFLTRVTAIFLYWHTCPKVVPNHKQPTNQLKQHEIASFGIFGENRILVQISNFTGICFNRGIPNRSMFKLPRHCFQSAHQSLLELLEDLRQLIQTQPDSFPHSASVNGLDRRSKSHDTQQGATERMNLSLECLCMIKGSDPKHLRTNTFSKNMKIWGWTLLPFQIWQCTRMKEIMSRVFSRIRDERWLPCVSKMTRTRTTVIVQLNMILTTKMNSHQNEFTCTYDYICVSISVEQSCGHQKALRATSRCSFKWRKQLLRIFGPELI